MEAAVRVTAADMSGAAGKLTAVSPRARRRRPVVAVLVAMFCLFAICVVWTAGCGQLGTQVSPGGTRVVTDMGGRRVTVPRSISRVFCSNPIGTIDLYTLDPDLLAGWNFAPSSAAKPFIASRYLKLPSLGVWMGAGATPNIEAVLTAHPDVILCFWTVDAVGVRMANEIQQQTGVPVVLVDSDIRSAPATFAFLGRLLGRPARAARLASYCRTQLARIRRVVAATPVAQHPSVFVAEGLGGLETDPVGSLHVQDAFDLLGVRDVVAMPGAAGKGMGMPTVSLEQVIDWRPGAVLVSEYDMGASRLSDLYDQIRADPGWRAVSAVRVGRVFRIPQVPFAWLGRPPSVARLLGSLWLAKALYPAAAHINLVAETQRFFRLFYRYDLSNRQAESLLAGSGVS